METSPSSFTGGTPDRKRMVVVDPAYEPYFYLLPKNLNSLGQLPVTQKHEGL